VFTLAASNSVVDEPSMVRNESAQLNLGRVILRNTLFVSSGGGLIRLLSFAYTIFYVRMLGEHAYGQYATVLAFTGLFAIFFELGTTQYVERSLAQDPARLPELLWMLVVVRLALALAGIAILPLLASAFGYASLVVLGVLIQTLSFIFAALHAPLLAILTSHERYDLWTASQMIGQLAAIALGSAVLWLTGDLLLFMASGLVALQLPLLFCVLAIRRANFGSMRFRFDPGRVRAFLKASLPFALTSLALTISFNVDTFLISLLQPSNVVGWYSAAYRLVPTIVSILGGFLTVITPSLARTYMSDREAVHRWTKTSLLWLTMFGLPAAVGTSLLAGQIIPLLYGAAFAPAIPVLVVISWDIPLRLFNAFAGNVTAAVGLERKAWRIFMTGALLGVVLYVPAIMLFGMLGAAVVTVLTDGLNAALFFRLLDRHLQLREVGASMARVAAAAALMGLVVWALRPLAILPVIVAAGALAFLAAALTLGLIDQQTRSRIVALLARGRRGA
jgi:O-antigen/teichoic acid export membrane protein